MIRRELIRLAATILLWLPCSGVTIADDVCPPEYPISFGFEFRVTGTADGSGISWCLNAGAYSFCDSNVTIPAGTPAPQAAQLLAASIAAQCPNVTAGANYNILTITVPYSIGHPELWPTLCIGRAGEAPLCCMPAPHDSCQVGFTIENRNYDCKCGDADNNGMWTVSDPVYLVAYIFGGGPAPVAICAGDADGSKIVTISDAVYLIVFIFGGGPAPSGC